MISGQEDGARDRPSRPLRQAVFCCPGEEPRPCWRTNINIRRRESQGDPRSAGVTLGITTNGGTVVLGGIIVRETTRKGCLALNLPPLEDWEGGFKRLTREQVERISFSGFYDFLRVHIRRKYLDQA